MAEIYAEDLANILESLDSAAEQMNGFGQLISAEVEIKVESAVTVTAPYEDGRWAVDLS